MEEYDLPQESQPVSTWVGERADQKSVKIVKLEWKLGGNDTIWAILHSEMQWEQTWARIGRERDASEPHIETFARTASGICNFIDLGGQEVDDVTIWGNMESFSILFKSRAKGGWVHPTIMTNFLPGWRHCNETSPHSKPTLDECWGCCFGKAV